ncbi:MAG: type II secretion system protein [Thermodesulfobacteriota bacterium]
MKNPLKKDGFTLVEVIIVLIVTSLFASILITFMQSVFSRTGESAYETAAVHHINQVMDNITGLYMSSLYIDASGDSDADGALEILNEKISDSGTNNNDLGRFKAEKVWYDSHPFNENGSSDRSGSSRFLKITVTDPANSAVSVTSIFWSGK